MFNLVSNAIKFSDENAYIELGSNVVKKVSCWRCRIMELELLKTDQEHLFSSFFRAANATNIQGTGLGLHLVKRYADLLDGNLKLQSELNQGTLVTIFIPINKGHENSTGHWW